LAPPRKTYIFFLAEPKKNIDSAKNTLFKFIISKQMYHTLPEAKRREAILRVCEGRKSKRKLKMIRSKARNNKYMFVREFTADESVPKEVEKPETQENKE
jgi:hypothetical protein